jgi:hypothetical protein
MHEFRSFVSTQLPSGIWRLAADGTNHDDTVLSTALAKEAASMNVELPDKQPEQKSKWLEQREDDGEGSRWRQ